MICVLIPAYNEPELLYRAIKSIIEQDYRPIKIFVADDASPKQLLSTKQIEYFTNITGIDFVFKKFSQNVGAHLNFLRAVKLIDSKYFIYFQHDDYFIDNNFISRAITSLNNTNNVYAYLSNSRLEVDQTLMLNGLGPDQIFLIKGQSFLSEFFTKYITNYSAVILDLDTIIKRNYFDILVNQEDVRRYRVVGDEGFVGLILLSINASIFIDTSVTVIRGYNKDSWSRSVYWRNHVNSAVFLTYFKLIKYFVSIKLFRSSFILSKQIIRYYPINKINLKLIFCIKPALLSITLHVLSWIILLVRKLKKYK